MQYVVRKQDIAETRFGVEVYKYIFRKEKNVCHNIQT